MTVEYRDKKKFLKWLSDNIYQIDKFTKVTPIPGDTDDVAMICIEIGTESNKLIIELDQNRINLIDFGLHCFSIAQKMSDEPIKINGKAH